MCDVRLPDEWSGRLGDTRLCGGGGTYTFRFGGGHGKLSLCQVHAPYVMRTLLADVVDALGVPGSARTLACG